MKHSISISYSIPFILFLLVLASHAGFSQTTVHSHHAAEIFELRSGEKRWSTIDTRDTKLQTTDGPLNVVGPIFKPYTLYGNEPSGTADFYITFNLENKQIVRYELVSVEGRTLIRDAWPEVSNQTFLVESNTVSSGLYIFRMQIGDELYVNRVYFTQ